MKRKFYIRVNFKFVIKVGKTVIKEIHLPNHSLIRSFSHSIYIAPFRDNLLRGATSPTPVIKYSFQMRVKLYAESLAKRTRK